MPTFRRCLARAREELFSIGQHELYEDILSGFGSGLMRTAEVESYLEAALRAYDRALQTCRSPSSPSLRLHPCVRRYAAEGALEMIRQGLHREAMSWILHFHTVAQVALEFDPPDENERAILWPEYERLLIALGLGTPAALRRSAERATILAERVFRLVDDIVSQYAD